MKGRPITEEQALQKLTALCAASEHCIYEMTQKMDRWELPEEVQTRIVEYLLKEKFIDETRYCRIFALDKIRFNKWGRRKVEQALWLKRIPKDICREVLSEIDEEEYMQVLRPLLQSKLRSTKARNAYELRGKLIRFAAGRGFLMEQIMEAIGGLVV